MSFLTIVEDNESFEYSPTDPDSGERMSSVFMLRLVPTDVAKEMRRKHLKVRFENHQRVEAVDHMAFTDDLVDYAITDWTGIKSARSNADLPCTSEHKRKLPQRVKDEVVRLCALNEAGGELAKAEQEKKTLGEYLEWETDELNKATCCLQATAEALEIEPELYNCASCPVRTERQKLSPENLQAFEVYHWLARRLVVDFQLAPLVFELLGLRVTRAEGLALLEQLHLIHEARNPVRKTDG